MKQRKEKEGRMLVANFVASGRTRREYATDAGISFSGLQYWIRRVKTLDGKPAANRFVEIALPQGGVGSAVQISSGGVQVSLASLPPAGWLSEFICSIEK